MAELALSAPERDWIIQTVHRLVPGARLRVFGSRASGRARPFSDLDLLLCAPQRLNWQQRCDLADAFDAGPLPFRVDVVEEAALAPGMRARILAEARPLHDGPQ